MPLTKFLCDIFQLLGAWLGPVGAKSGLGDWSDELHQNRPADNFDRWFLGCRGWLCAHHTSFTLLMRRLHEVQLALSHATGGFHAVVIKRLFVQSSSQIFVFPEEFLRGNF